MAFHGLYKSSLETFQETEPTVYSANICNIFHLTYIRIYFIFHICVYGRRTFMVTDSSDVNIKSKKFILKLEVQETAIMKHFKSEVGDA